MLKRRAARLGTGGLPVTHAEFARWWRRAEIAFVALTIVSAGSAYLGYRAGQDSDRNLRTSSADAVYRSCESRWEGRLTTVRAIDDLRLSALRPAKNGRQARLISEFIARTQVPLDSLLSQAAGRRVKTPPGRVQPGTYARVRADAHAQCLAQRANFGKRSHALGE